MDWSKADAEQRARLESNSHPGTRANRAADLNKMASGHPSRELPGLSAYGLLRLAQNGHAAEVRHHNAAHARYMRKEAAERPWHDPDNAADERHVTPLREGETYNRVLGCRRQHGRRCRDARHALERPGHSRRAARAQCRGFAPPRGDALSQPVLVTMARAALDHRRVLCAARRAFDAAAIGRQPKFWESAGLSHDGGRAGVGKQPSAGLSCDPPLAESAPWQGDRASF